MKVCPKCGKVVSYNSYFEAYICKNCNWEYKESQTKSRSLLKQHQHAAPLYEGKYKLVKYEV